MGFSFEAEDQGFSFVIKKAQSLGVKDFRTAFRRTGNAWLRFVDEGFDSGRDPYGNPWAPLSKQYAEDKARAGYPLDILIRDGDLRRSFHREENRTGFAIFSDRVFDDGTDASIHQFGGVHPVTNAFIPQRQMLPYDGFPPHWQQIAEGYLNVDIDRAFNFGPGSDFGGEE